MCLLPAVTASASDPSHRRRGTFGALSSTVPPPYITNDCDRIGHGSEGYYRRALEVAEAVGEPQLLVPCYEGLATLAIERDDEAEAEAWLAKSHEVQRTTGWTSDTFLVLPFLA